MFKGKKSYLMETFYRKMRQKHGVLLNQQGEPEGGQWNYDAANRKKYDGKTKIPPLSVSGTAETSALLQEIALLLQENEVDTLGQYPTENFPWPLHREAALQLLAHFCAYLLPFFGTFQDAMQAGEPFLFHSRLSFALNAKLLSPQEVVDAAIAAWKESPERIGLAQVEGFVRQIIGWREYMRGIYWAKMPQYATLNFFGHRRALPQFYWTGRTQMRCMSQAIGQSLQWAYAHHIQRLMITGNFALLAGISPDEVDEWYLGIYIDAIEWVEITNTRGMSQFADGGIVGTKPYVSSANYIHKMSDYCKGCYYNKDKRHGDRACPFNSLYWHFYHRHRALLASNPRIGMAYVTLNKMPAEELDSTLRQAEEYLQKLDEL
jgi:deoxyribodipyrimidine photolyase-related protein